MRARFIGLWRKRSDHRYRSWPATSPELALNLRHFSGQRLSQPKLRSHDRWTWPMPHRLPSRVKMRLRFRWLTMFYAHLAPGAVHVLRDRLAEIAVDPVVAAGKICPLVRLRQLLDDEGDTHRRSISSAWRFAARASRVFGWGGSGSCRADGRRAASGRRPGPGRALPIGRSGMGASFGSVMHGIMP
jgi:hypothetical protein